MQELLQVADAVAREKNIDREIVISAMEEAIQKAGCSKYGYDHDIRAQIDRTTGEISLFRYRNVVEEFNPETPELETQQILLKQAKKIKSDIQLGDHIIDKLPPLDFGRIAAQTAKQVIFQKVRDAERERQFEEYKDRIGEIVSGVVKRVEYGNITVDLGRGEAFLRRNDALPREHFKNGERVRVSSSSGSLITRVITTGRIHPNSAAIAEPIAAANGSSTTICAALALEATGKDQGKQ